MTQHKKSDFTEASSRLVLWIELSSFLGCYNVLTGKYLLTFWRRPVPLSSGSSHTACFFDYSTPQMEAIDSSAPVNIVQHHRRLESSSLLPKEPLNIGCH